MRRTQRRRGGDLRRFSTHHHPVDGGRDVYARPMSLGVLKQEGASGLQRKMPAAPAPLLKAITPERDALGSGVDCLVTWSWLADLCAQAGLPCVLGHALSLQASPGGKATHDTLDAHKIAVRRRGGMLPPADVYPAERRATRDRLRRRLDRTRQRAERLTHGQHTNRSDHLAESGPRGPDARHGRPPRGVLRSRGAVPADPSRGPAIPRAPRDTTEPGHSPDGPGPAMGVRRL